MPSCCNWKTRIRRLDSSDQHPPKVIDSMEVIELGRLTEVNARQYSNALSPMEVTEFGISTVVMPEHCQNPRSHMVVTELGILTDLSLYVMKEYPSIEVTQSGMVMWLLAPGH